METAARVFLPRSSDCRRYLEGISAIQLTIDVTFEYIDGQSGTLASAGPTSAGYYTASGGEGDGQQFVIPTRGIMTFDTADYCAECSSGDELGDVILHELGHVLGIGTLWRFFSPPLGGTSVTLGDGSISYTDYTGANGTSAYDREMCALGPSCAFIPVEQEGGSGTAGGHWDENLFGNGPTGVTTTRHGTTYDMQFELMAGWLNTPVWMAAFTARSCRDLGYYTQACVDDTDCAVGDSCQPYPGCDPDDSATKCWMPNLCAIATTCDAHECGTGILAPDASSIFGDTDIECCVGYTSGWAPGEPEPCRQGSCRSATHNTQIVPYVCLVSNEPAPSNEPCGTRPADGVQTCDSGVACTIPQETDTECDAVTLTRTGASSLSNGILGLYTRKTDTNNDRPIYGPGSRLFESQGVQVDLVYQSSAWRFMAPPDYTSQYALIGNDQDYAVPQQHEENVKFYDGSTFVGDPTAVVRCDRTYEACADRANFIDAYGDDCTMYYQKLPLECEFYGSTPNNDGVTPNDACCACGGGDSTAPKLLVVRPFATLADAIKLAASFDVWELHRPCQIGVGVHAKLSHEASILLYAFVCVLPLRAPFDRSPSVPAKLKLGLPRPVCVGTIRAISQVTRTQRILQMAQLSRAS